MTLHLGGRGTIEMRCLFLLHGTAYSTLIAYAIAGCRVPGCNTTPRESQRCCTTCSANRQRLIQALGGLDGAYKPITQHLWLMATPAQLLFGHHIRTPFPLPESSHKLEWSDWTDLQERERKAEGQHARQSDRCHEAELLPPLKPGGSVRARIYHWS